MKKILLVSLIALGFSGLSFSSENHFTGIEAGNIVKKFWFWAAKNGQKISKLEPKSRIFNGKYVLKDKELPQLLNEFHQTNLFAKEFDNHVIDYYKKVKEDLDKVSKEEVARQKKEGFEIMFGYEEMDLFFCAQEYDTSKQFIESLSVVNFKLQGDRAIAKIKSPYGWETNFIFVNENGAWKIEKYCLF